LSVTPSTISGYTYEFKNAQLRITGISDNVEITGQEFKFTWKVGENNDIIADEKVFRLNSIISEVDYDLIVPQIAVNLSSEQAITNSITVLKKTKDGQTTISTPGTDDLQIYANGSKLDDWVEEYSYANNSSSIHYALKIGSQVWDE
jgi:hypothetical protein